MKIDSFRYVTIADVEKALVRRWPFGSRNMNVRMVRVKNGWAKTARKYYRLYFGGFRAAMDFNSPAEMLRYVTKRHVDESLAHYERRLVEEANYA